MKLLFFFLLSLISVAFFTLLERKILGLIGLRLGPMKSMMWGLFQPIYDAMKISQKQTNLLTNMTFFMY